MRNGRTNIKIKRAANLSLTAMLLGCLACTKESPELGTPPVPSSGAASVRQEPAQSQFIRTCTPKGEWTDEGYCPKLCGWVDSLEPLCDSNERCVDPESARKIAQAGRLPVSWGCYDTCDDSLCREGFRCIQGEISVPAGSRTFQAVKLCLPEKPLEKPQH